MKKRNVFAAAVGIFMTLCMSAFASESLSGVIKEVYITDGLGDKVQCLVLTLDEEKTFNVYDDFGESVNVTTKEIQLSSNDYTPEMNGTRVTATGNDIFQGSTFYHIRPVTMLNATLMPEIVQEESVPEISVSVNGEQLVFDQPPVIRNDRTFVPIRAICEKLGASVNWDDQEKRADIFSADGSITLYIDYAAPKINGITTIIDAAPFIENGRTLVPVRVIAQTLGASVDWDGDSRSVTITQNQDMSDYSEYLKEADKPIVYDMAGGGEFKAPYINLKSADKLNSDINSLYKEYSEYAYEMSFTYSVNKNVLSLVYSVMCEEEYYFCYNIDITSGEEISLGKICEMAGLSESDFTAKTNEKCVSAFDSLFSAAEVKSAKDSGAVSEEFCNSQRSAAGRCFTSSSKWFIGSDNTVNALIYLPSLYGGDYMYAVNTGITLK